MSNSAVCLDCMDWPFGNSTLIAFVVVTGVISFNGRFVCVYLLDGNSKKFAVAAQSATVGEIWWADTDDVGKQYLSYVVCYC